MKVLLKITPSQPIEFSYNQEKLEITAEKDESHDGHYRIKIKNLELPKHFIDQKISVQARPTGDVLGVIAVSGYSIK